MTDLDKDRAQVAAQCRVIVHLAKALIEVHSDYAKMFDEGWGLASDATGVDMVGKRTASFMETLGDMLNGMDAVSEDDDWTSPVFRAAQQRWPVRPA